jgi:uncharacterized membrane protein
MSETPETTTPAPPKRVKKRILIPALFMAVVAALLVYAIVRGNWVDDKAQNPASAEDGVMTQILRRSDGHVELRGAVIVNSAPDRVWKVVTDYDHFSEIFPNISSSKGVRDPDGRWHLTGEVRSIVGRWPMDVHVRHDESTSTKFTSWDEPHGAWTVNRGSWVVTPQAPDRTLLEYDLELKVSPFPDFVVRTVLLSQLKPVLKAAANRAERDQPSR